MNTVKLTVSSRGSFSPEDLKKIDRAAAVLNCGGLVAFPTETVYGLGANALDPSAVEKIFYAKSRPPDNPLIVHIADIRQLDEVADKIPVLARTLAEAFWPGPLTLLLKKKTVIPNIVTAGSPNVCVRLPAHPLARILIARAGVPVAAPSANRSGQPSPTRAAHVIRDLDGKIDMLLDGGPCEVGVESTILDLTGENPVILRPGAVTKEMLTAYADIHPDPRLSKPPAEGERPPSPGMKYRHYAPRAPLTVVRGEPDRIVSAVNAILMSSEDASVGAGSGIGVMATLQTASRYIGGRILVMGDRNVPKTIAENLYATLRAFDETNVREIYAEGISDAGIGAAVMNRLTRAAGFRIIDL